VKRIKSLSYLKLREFFISNLTSSSSLYPFIPLILGAKPTARTTEAFLIIELIVLGSFLSIGLVSLPTHIVNQFNWNSFLDLSYFALPKSLLALTATMVIVATILDGWEIDSYASEESKKPNRWPGLS